MEQASSQPTPLQPHGDTVLTIVQAALEGFKIKHPDLDGKALEQFRAIVETKVRKKKNVNFIASESRKTLRKFVGEEMTALGLSTAHIRLDSVLEVVDTHSGKMVEIDRERLANGGATLVYKVVNDQLVIAAAICSVDDNYDRLNGRSLALKRFKQGVTVTLDGTGIKAIDANLFRQYYLDLLRQQPNSKAS